jgi:hypothetical protein
MLIQTDEKSVALSPFGSLALNGAANPRRGGGQSWIEIVRTSRLAVSLQAWLSQPCS